jgi:hypothetical protein
MNQAALFLSSASAANMVVRNRNWFRTAVKIECAMA